MNPGGLYGQARPENFPHVNDYRASVKDMGNGLCAVTKLTVKPETVLGMLK